MNVLKSIFCWVFGYCTKTYTDAHDPVTKRYNEIELRMRWMPRDILDI